ncbi:unnamed protein product [Periconia digitata]|uniref:Uncharacterized protein n=1 Tax=Periconia digitata TaxID=1303443 RepID=A0A9W4XJ40_9PLEO|nr:unnamed protein product [Periconia digitata]
MVEHVRSSGIPPSLKVQSDRSNKKLISSPSSANDRSSKTLATSSSVRQESRDEEGGSDEQHSNQQSPEYHEGWLAGYTVGYKNGLAQKQAVPDRTGV